MPPPFVVVCQDIHGHASAIVASSLAARQTGIRAGMAVRTVMRRYPHIHLVPRRPDLEATARDDLFALFDRYTPQVRLSHIGNFGRWLCDLSGTPASRTMTPQQLGDDIVLSIKREIGFTDIFMGLCSTAPGAQLLAAAATTEPVTVCFGQDHEQERMLGGISCDAVYGLTAVTREALRGYGIYTIGQLAFLTRHDLVKRLGRDGEHLYAVVQGVSAAAAGAAEKYLTGPLTASIVLRRDTNDLAELAAAVRYTADKLCHQLRSQSVCADALVVELCYTDRKKIRKTVRLGADTQDFGPVASAAQHAVTALYQRRVALSSITLTVARPQPFGGQLELFDTARTAAHRSTGAAITDVRRAYAFEAVVSGSCLAIAQEQRI